ncbi:MAG: DUF3231 family protein [Negativicutes bacterium]|nr:DUF3231 family protein [Negativicutes bacterium]MDR3591828.1 DUF3231 family protein [Negativicutes bacterium]
MTTIDKINTSVNTTINQMFDKEPLNYFETAGLMAVVAAGRQNLSSLEVLYNQARDHDLRTMLKRAIDEQTQWLLERAEKMLAQIGASLPDVQFARRKLHDAPLQMPDDACFTDREIALGLANVAKMSQMAVMGAMHQTYKPEIAAVYRDVLDAAFDFDYRLLKLTLDKGWLPHLPKVEH